LGDRVIHAHSPSRMGSAQSESSRDSMIKADLGKTRVSAPVNMYTKICLNHQGQSFKENDPAFMLNMTITCDRELTFFTVSVIPRAFFIIQSRVSLCPNPILENGL